MLEGVRVRNVSVSVLLQAKLQATLSYQCKQSAREKKVLCHT